MEPVRRAVIDVGTNSVKALVADLVGDLVKPVFEESKQTRLGKGLYEKHRLASGAIAETANAVAVFAQTARQLGASSLRVFATSASREATNADELLNRIETAASVRPQVISGEQEADWAFRGVLTDPQYRQAPLLIVDLGGGSSEFIVADQGRKQFSRSFRMGTVRLIETIPHSDPPRSEELQDCRVAVRKLIRTEVAPSLEPFLSELRRKHAGGVLLVGTGGTATILGCMHTQSRSFDRAIIEGAVLSSAQLEAQVARLWSLPLAERQEIPGLPKNRADVILAGSLVYAEILSQLCLSELRISTRGLRFAAVQVS